MKTVVVAAVALLAGIFLGGLGPRGDARRLERELADAKQAAERSGGPASMLPLALSGLAAAQAQAEAQGERRVPRFVVPDGAREEERPRRGRGDGGRRGSPTQALAAAKLGMEVRAAQFREAFIQEAKLSPERVTALDEVVRKFNDELVRAAEEAVQSFSPGATPKPRDFVGLAAKLSDVYLRADKSLRESLDDTGKAALDKTDFDLMTQADLGAFQKLAEQMEKARPAERRP